MNFVNTSASLLTVSTPSPARLISTPSGLPLLPTSSAASPSFRFRLSCPAGPAARCLSSLAICPAVPVVPTWLWPVVSVTVLPSSSPSVGRSRSDGTGWRPSVLVYLSSVAGRAGQRQPGANGTWVRRGGLTLGGGEVVPSRKEVAREEAEGGRKDGVAGLFCDQPPSKDRRHT